MRRFIIFLYKIYMVIVYRPKVVGKENIPREGGALLCPNHVHALDSTIIIASERRKINVLAKAELFKLGIARAFAKLFGIYPVDTKKKDINSIKISLKILKNNELLMIFPEGTRNGLAKKVKPKKGAIKIAITAGVPIIPIGIQGNFKPFKKVKVNIGKPMDFTMYRDKIRDEEQMDILLDKLMNEIIRLTNEKI